jgi:hypothetical protein
MSTSSTITKFETRLEAEAYLAGHAQEFSTLEGKICPLIKVNCCGPRCACWEPARVLGSYSLKDQAATWYIKDTWCKSPFINGMVL